MSLVLLEAGHDHPTWEDFGPIEWITLVVAGIAAGVIVWKAVMYTLRPGEQEPDHIKRQVLEEPAAGPGGAPLSLEGASTDDDAGDPPDGTEAR